MQNPFVTIQFNYEQTITISLGEVSGNNPELVSTINEIDKSQFYSPSIVFGDLEFAEFLLTIYQGQIIERLDPIEEEGFVVY